MSFGKDVRSLLDAVRVAAKDKNIRMADMRHIGMIPLKVGPLEERYFVKGFYVIIANKSERLNARRKESKHETVLHQS